MKYLIGIDAGTSNVKSVLFNTKGEEIKAAYRDNEPLYLEGGKVEQDMELLWDKVLETLVEVTQGIEADKVAGISVTGQGEGCWLIDENGEPVQNAILWNDARAVDIVAEINADKELYDYIYNHIGAQALNGTSLTLLLWMKKHKKEVLDKADKLLFPKDWVRYKLTGKAAWDYSDAATAFLNIENLEFDKELFERVGLQDYIHLVPEIHGSNEIAGTITQEVAKATGLNPDTPVSYGALDVIATTMGVGGIRDGDVCTILGTTVASNVVQADINVGQENRRYEKHMVEGLYVDLKPTMSGTVNIDWIYDSLTSDLSYADVDAKLLEMPPVPNGVIFHPYLSLSGERSPFYDPNARASFFGISNLTDRLALAKAVYEGIAYSIRDCLDAADLTDDSVIYLAGGGAASDPWKQIIADVTGRIVIVADGKEFAAKGVVLGLSVELGIHKTYRDAALSMVHAKEIYNPNEENTKIYDKYFELYKKGRETFTDLWELRADILKEIGVDG